MPTATTGSLALKRRPKFTDVADPARVQSESTGSITESIKPKRESKRRGSEPMAGSATDELRNVSTEIVQQVISIPLEKLHRHPSNRTITPESVTELVQSLQDHGQREPIRVREHPDKIGHYEIISGERRFVAAGQVKGIDSLAAIVESMTDSTSIIELAVANAARKDLDPIERAELLAELIKPIADGGGGMDRDAAGRIFGLNSESGVKNTLRLLKLPKYFRDLLASGEITVGKIRPLCAYPDAFLSKLADWIQKNLKNSSCTYYWIAKRWISEFEGDTDRLIQSFVRDCTRPVGDKRFTHDHGYQLGWAHPCLFDLAKLTESDRTALQIIDIPDGQKGIRSVAINTKLWHKLQDPLVAAKVKAKSKPPKESTKAKAGSKSPSAAELKAKRKKQDDQLAQYTRNWICTALRCTMANRTAPHRVLALAPWLINAFMLWGNVFSEIYQWAVSELVGSNVKQSKYGGRWSDSAKESDALQSIRSAEFWAALWRVALWPVATRNDTNVGLATIGTIPDNMPRIDSEKVHELATTLGVSMETVWQHASEDGWERSLVLRWLEYHTKDQLTDLPTAQGHSEK
ncbi:MAG: ParB/RepB/Spo0J family partition protein [Pirellulales bacterium]